MYEALHPTDVSKNYGDAYLANVLNTKTFFNDLIFKIIDNKDHSSVDDKRNYFLIMNFPWMRGDVARIPHAVSIFPSNFFSLGVVFNFHFNNSCQKTTPLAWRQPSLNSSQGQSCSKVGQSSRSRSQGQKLWYRMKGLVTRNTHVQYESPITSGLKGYSQG